MQLGTRALATAALGALGGVTLPPTVCYPTTAAINAYTTSAAITGYTTTAAITDYETSASIGTCGGG